MIGIAFILFTIVLAIDLWTDSYRIRKGLTVNHFRGTVFRALGLLPSTILLANNITIWIVTGLILSDLLLFSLWWLLFDGLLNLLTGHPWNHVGSTSSLDKILSEMSVGERWALKISLILISGFIYVNCI